jgi:putative DNA primase/helicase
VAFNSRVYPPPSQGGNGSLRVHLSARPVDRVIEALRARGLDPQQEGTGWKARCPAHEDRKPSLGVSEGDDGKALIVCRAGCDFKSIVAALGLTTADLFLQGTNGHANGHVSAKPRKPKSDGAVFATFEAARDWMAKTIPAAATNVWSYTDADGAEIFRVQRFDEGSGDKRFKPFRHDPDGWRIKDPLGKLPLYRLPELTAATDVWVFEGEKCVDLAKRLGLVATTSAHGSKSAKRSDWSPLAGDTVYLVPDNDAPGEKYVADVIAELAKLDPKPTIKVVRLPLNNKGDDLAEWLESVPDGWGPDECRAELERIATTASECATTTTTSDVPKNPSQFARTDRGNAERLVAQHGQDFRFCGPWKKFLVWDGCRWTMDSTNKLCRQAKATARTILAEALEAANDDDRKTLISWWTTTESRRGLESMISLASSEAGIPVVPEGLNSDPWLLNVQNGTIDLKTGQLRQHRRADLIMSMAPVDYDPNAKCPLWIKTLSRIFAGNDDMIRFWRRLCGLALTGVVDEQVLPILCGGGANGKSTVLTVMLEMLGSDYSLMAPPGILMTRRSDSHPTERAILHGKRLVVDVESAEGGRLNEALVKQLTGGDKISARRMREDFWEFSPTHKLMLCTNHRPEIKETKHAIWRRIKMIPFNVTIPEAEQIKDLPRRLRFEFPGILAWCVQGCLEWQREGLGVPSEVDDATKEYRAEQDVLAAFLAEECTVNPVLSAKFAHLYNRYTRWTEGCREALISQRAFGLSLSERGFEKYTNNGTFYRGLGLRADSGSASHQPY